MTLIKDILNKLKDAFLDIVLIFFGLLYAVYAIIAFKKVKVWISTKVIGLLFTIASLIIDDHRISIGLIIVSLYFTFIAKDEPLT